MVFGLAIALPPAGAADLPSKTEFRRAPAADFTGLDRVEAFRRAHDKLSHEYAFATWKGIRWPALYRRALPAIEAAAADGDDGAYFLALLAYISGIDDGHVSLPRNPATAPLIDAAIARLAGAGFGLGLARLDDGRVIAARVVPGSSAAEAGIVPGAEVIMWNGAAITAALDAVDLAQPAAARVATDEYRRLEQVRLLTRASAGTTAEVAYRNPGAPEARTVRLAARDDGPEGRDLLNFAPLPSAADEDAVVTAKSIGPYGYVRMAALADLKDLARSPEFIWDAYTSAIDGFARAGAPGLLLDIRGNHGGYDILAEMICGTLYQQPAFYEATVFYDAATGRFRRLTVDDRTGAEVDALMIEPEDPQFTGPVAVLVNPRSISSAEGLARCVRDRSNGAVVGFHGTRGSFGLAGGEIALPGGIVLHFPDGYAIDAEGRVLLDSRNGVGGVAPTVRVPMTEENVLAYANGVDVELREAVRWLDGLRAGRGAATP